MQGNDDYLYLEKLWNNPEKQNYLCDYELQFVILDIDIN